MANSTKGNRGSIKGSRNLKVKVKDAKKKSNASARWLQRQLNDPYVAEAKRLGYRSRAAFKLLEIDERFSILQKGQTVVDLGAAPGGWCQIVSNKVGLGERQGKLVAIDLLEMEAVPYVEHLTMDFFAEDADQKLKDLIGGNADVVLSDMAANTVGHKSTDHLRTMALVEGAYDFALQVLAPGGHFLAKVFKGGTENELLKQMKQSFVSVKHVKPNASRSDSSEAYLLAKGFRSGQIDQ